MLQGVTGGYKGLQGSRRDYKRLQGVQEVSGVCKGLQGPVLFLRYRDDLPNCVMYSQPRMYADDTNITYANNDVEKIERCVNIDLDRIRIWLAANKLTLNTTKTISVKWVQVKTVNAKKESHN